MLACREGWRGGVGVRDSDLKNNHKPNHQISFTTYKVRLEYCRRQRGEAALQRPPPLPLFPLLFVVVFAGRQEPVSPGGGPRGGAGVGDEDGGAGEGEATEAGVAGGGESEAEEGVCRFVLG